MRFIGTYGTNGDDDGKSNPELTGTAGVNDVIYGFDGNDTLRGSVGNGADENDNNSRDVLLGGRGNDRLFGRGDNDQLFGQQNSDLLFGGRGDDIVNGGPDSDVLYGGDNILDNVIGRSDSDRFVLGPGEGTDFILDFNPANDKIALIGPATPDNISLMQVDQVNLTELGLPPETQVALGIQETIRQGPLGELFGGSDTTAINYQGEMLGLLRSVAVDELSGSNFIKYTDIDLTSA